MYPPHICLSLAKACHDETSMPHSSLLSANPALLKQQHMENVASRPFHELSKERGWNEKAKDIFFSNKSFHRESNGYNSSKANLTKGSCIN